VHASDPPGRNRSDERRFGCGRRVLLIPGTLHGQAGSKLKPAPAPPAAASPAQLSLPIQRKPWTGDLDAMVKPRPYSSTRRNRRALVMTDTELNVIAALAQIGLTSTPVKGYSAPAATGTPTAL
jgi:hypothetical protein